MAIKLVDELKAMGNFPIAHAEGINLVKTDGTEDNLQNLFDNGELIGGGGDSSVTLTQQEYEALPEEEKLDGLYYTYDTKRIYKNGVQYGASDAEGIGYNNAESGIQATTVQGAIDKVVKTVEDAYAKKTEIPTTLPANGGNANTVNNHTVKSDVPENAVFTDTIYDDTELNAKLSEKANKADEAKLFLKSLADGVNSFYSESENDEACLNDRKCKRTSSEPCVWFRLVMGTDPYEGWLCIGLTENSVKCNPLTEYGGTNYSNFTENGITFYIGFMSNRYPTSQNYEFYITINGKKYVPANRVYTVSTDRVPSLSVLNTWYNWQEIATMDKVIPFTRLEGGFKVVAYSDRTITGNSKLECLENWVTKALSKYGDNLVIIGNIFNTPYMDGFAIVNVWGSKKDGILGASGIVVNQEGMYYYKTQNGVPGSGTLTKII